MEKEKIKVDESGRMELDRFPDYLNGYDGIVCSKCNVVFYAPKGSKIIDMCVDDEDCPICGEDGLFWIEKSDIGQPEGERDSD